jgi:hypothetical protein
MERRVVVITDGCVMEWNKGIIGKNRLDGSRYVRGAGLKIK